VLPIPASSHSVVVSTPTRRPLERFLPDGPRAHALSLRELEQIRDRIHRSVDRTQAEIDRVEALIVVAKFREEKRAARKPAADGRSDRGMAQE
jgi:hypothetical protein